MFRCWCLATMLSFLVIPEATAQEHPGAESYRQVCQLCHGERGRGDIAPALVPMGFDAEYVLAVVREGYGQMPPISQRELSDDDVRQAVGYLESLSSGSAGQAEASYDGPRTPQGPHSKAGAQDAIRTFPVVGRGAGTRLEAGSSGSPGGHPARAANSAGG